MSSAGLAIILFALVGVILLVLGLALLIDRRDAKRAAAEHARLDDEIAAARRRRVGSARISDDDALAAYRRNTREPRPRNVDVAIARRQFRDAPERRAAAIELVDRAEGGLGPVSLLALADDGLMPGTSADWPPACAPVASDEPAACSAPDPQPTGDPQ